MRRSLVASPFWGRILLRSKSRPHVRGFIRTIIMRPSPPFELVQASLEAHSPPCKVGARGAARPRVRAARCACGPSGSYNETVPPNTSVSWDVRQSRLLVARDSFPEQRKSLDQLAGAACMHAWKPFLQRSPHPAPSTTRTSLLFSPQKATDKRGPSCAAHTHT